MRKSRLSKIKQDRLIEHFVAGTTARTTAVLVGANKSTASYYFHRLREFIFKAVEDETPFSGEIEVDKVIWVANARAREAEALPESSRLWPVEAWGQSLRENHTQCQSHDSYAHNAGTYNTR